VYKTNFQFRDRYRTLPQHVKVTIYRVEFIEMKASFFL